MIEYTTEKGPGTSFRFEVRNPPAVGTMLDAGPIFGAVRFDGMHGTGMLICTDDNGMQGMFFPHQIKGLAAKGLDDGN